MSPLPWRFARTRRASSQRSLEASQRGDRGKKKKPRKRIRPGMAWTPQGILKAAVAWFGLLTPPSTKEQPYWMKYWIRIPHVMAH